MGVSAVKARSRLLVRVPRLVPSLAVVATVCFYFFGPPMTPAWHRAAADQCNELAGANYRSFFLTWSVGVRPHWLCANTARPAAPPVDLGWWVSPPL